MIVSDTSAQHLKNMEHLHAANQYAQWSEQDRMSKLPAITPEQRQQIYDYLAIVQQHGFSQSVAAHQQQQQEQGNLDENNLSTTLNSQCPIASVNHKSKTTGTK
jgi:hypothetical protein